MSFYPLIEYCLSEEGCRKDHESSGVQEKKQKKVLRGFSYDRTAVDPHLAAAGSDSCE